MAKQESTWKSPLVSEWVATAVLPALFLNEVLFTIIIIIIEFFTSRLWLGNIHLYLDVVINRIRLGGLICSLKSFLQLNMCQELQISVVVYMYSCAS